MTHEEDKLFKTFDKAVWTNYASCYVTIVTER